LRKSGKKVDIKTAEIWENNAEIWQLIAEFWQLIDFSQFAEIWENVAELWCFPLLKPKFSEEKIYFFSKKLMSCIIICLK
jgi:hypothetical protein